MPHRRVRLIVLVLAVVACTPDATLVPAGKIADSPATDTSGTDTTIVQRGTLTVTATVAPEDAGIASQLGWTSQVTGAAVQARRGTEVLTGTTDAAGRATFPDILPGAYQVSMLRALTDTERGLLSPGDADITSFGGGGTVWLTPPQTDVAITTRAGRRGSLVISEKFPSTWLGNDSYLFGTFIEIHNNADTTIFLDGILLGRGPYFLRDAPEYDRPCSVTQQWQTDPEGLWSGQLYRLPGAGQQYPLAPGESAVLATDAVDHSLVDPRWPNLINARFEFLGPADVDNPAAANITLAAVPSSTDPLGHGPRFDGDGILFLAQPLDLTGLPMAQPPNYPVSIPRIPRDKVLDVVMFMQTPDFYEKYGFQLCTNLISEAFDMGPAFILNPARFMSIERRRMGSQLLRTRATVNDFTIISGPTPGNVP